MDLQPVRRLGQGAFGSVTLVKHKYDGVKYALKKISKDDDRGSAVVARECSILQEVRRPFLLDYETAFETEDSFLVVTELLNGGDLFDLRHQVRRVFSNAEA